MTRYAGLDPTEAARFCDRWLSAWTGNDPERLAAFYTDDAYYSDPAAPDGIEGREALLGYFRRLLARNPEWTWTHERSLPVPDGFLNYWRARIPTERGEVECRGVCVVVLRDGLICRNEVYFDPTAMRAG